MNIDKLCIEFGFWATPRYETEFPRVAAGFAEIKPLAEYAYKYRVKLMNDELGMEIDAHLRTIRKVTPELFDVFVLTYVKRWERQDIWGFLHLSKREYYHRLKTAKTSLLLMLHTKGALCVWEG